MNKPVLLVVDDDAHLVLAAVRRDPRARYRESYMVISASSGEEALATVRELKARGDELALVMSDQRMPGIQGTEVPVLEGLSKHYHFSLGVPFNKLPKSVRDILLYGSEGEKISFSVKGRGAAHFFRQKFEGVIRELERRQADDGEGAEELEKFMRFIPCPECGGTRLKKEVLSIKVGGKSISEVTGLYIKETLDFLMHLQLDPRSQKIADGVLREIRDRLKFMMEVGLEYLSIDRNAATLSGGESQRIRLATQIGSSLVGVLYILDEPSTGLHQRDHLRLLGTLKRLRDLGNTVVVVEHDEETIRSADYIIDMARSDPTEKASHRIDPGFRVTSAEK